MMATAVISCDPGHCVRRPSILCNVQTSDDASLSGPAHTMAVLETFSPVFTELGIAEIAQRAMLSPAAVGPIATALCELGYLHVDGSSRRYRLGARLVGIARSFLGARGARAQAHGHLEALSARLRAPLALSERDGGEMVYLDYVRGDAPVVVQHRVGTRLPMATSASGRAWLASAPTVEVDAVIRRLGARSAQGEAVLAQHAAVAKQDLAELGFTRSYGDMNPEVNAVAVPLRSPIDGSHLVISLAAPSMLVPGRRCDTEFGPSLVAMVAEVKRELGEHD
ncbi:MAG: IclR family transcriptional regulator [Ramlibacter sp.]